MSIGNGKCRQIPLITWVETLSMQTRVSLLYYLILECNKEYLLGRTSGCGRVSAIDRVLANDRAQLDSLFLQNQQDGFTPAEKDRLRHALDHERLPCPEDLPHTIQSIEALTKVIKRAQLKADQLRPLPPPITQANLFERPLCLVPPPGIPLHERIVHRKTILSCVIKPLPLRTKWKDGLPLLKPRYTTMPDEAPRYFYNLEGNGRNISNMPITPRLLSDLLFVYSELFDNQCSIAAVRIAQLIMSFIAGCIVAMCYNNVAGNIVRVLAVFGCVVLHGKEEQRVNTGAATACHQMNRVMTRLGIILEPKRASTALYSRLSIGIEFTQNQHVVRISDVLMAEGLQKVTDFMHRGTATTVFPPFVIYRPRRLMATPKAHQFFRTISAGLQSAL